MTFRHPSDPPSNLYTGPWGFWGLFDPLSNLYTGQWGFGVFLQIYLRVHEVSGSLWPSFEITRGPMTLRGLIGPPSYLYTGPWGSGVSFQISTRVHEVSGSPWSMHLTFETPPSRVQGPVKEYMVWLLIRPLPGPRPRQEVYGLTFDVPPLGARAPPRSIWFGNLYAPSRGKGPVKEYMVWPLICPPLGAKAPSMSIWLEFWCAPTRGQGPPRRIWFDLWYTPSGPGPRQGAYGLTFDTPRLGVRAPPRRIWFDLWYAPSRGQGPAKEYMGWPLICPHLGAVGGSPSPSPLPVKNSQNLNQSKQQLSDMWWARRSVLCHSCHAQAKCLQKWSMPDRLSYDQK